MEELAAFERLEISHKLIMGKCYPHASSFIFCLHKSSDEFDFRPDQTTHFRVTCP